MWAILGCLKPVFGSSQRVTLMVTLLSPLCPQNFGKVAGTYK